MHAFVFTLYSCRICRKSNFRKYEKRIFVNAGKSYKVRERKRESKCIHTNENEVKKKLNFLNYYAALTQQKPKIFAPYFMLYLPISETTFSPLKFANNF